VSTTPRYKLFTGVEDTGDKFTAIIVDIHGQNQRFTAKIEKIEMPPPKYWGLGETEC
jgi:hypothetical protein